MPSTTLNLDALLRPRSIALVGVSRGAAQGKSMSGSTILESLVRFGFAGRIDVVHPSGESIAGRPSAKSIAELREPADLIVLALPAASAPATVDESGKRGIRAAAVLSAGFSELGDEEGLRLGAELESAARRHAMPICGPNGLGYINVWDRVLAGYFPCMLGDAQPRPGGLSIVTQSGAVGNSLLARAMDRAIGLSFVISSGNETNVALADYIDFLVADPKTAVVALYLEGVTDGAGLRGALARAAARGKPVVIYKVGKSASGAKAALSHTAKLAGEPALYRGLFRQLGAIEAQHLDDLLEIPMLMLKTADLDGRVPRGIGVVSISGGLGAIMADHFAAEGFELPELAGRTRARLAALPVKLGSTANPVDTTAAIQRNEELLADILAIVAEDEGVDAIVFPNAARFPGPALNVAGIMARSAATLAKPLLSVWYAGADNDAAMAALHASDRVACFNDPSACARALAALRDFRIFSARSADISAAHAGAEPAKASAAQGAPRRTLNEVDAKSILQRHGIAVPLEGLAIDAVQAVQVAERIGLPVAMKIVSADVPHKARVGGVRLGLQTADEVARGHAEMLARVRGEVPDAALDGVLISQMRPPKLELLAGAYRDAQFGWVLMVGIGGGQVEEHPDIALRLLPASQADCVDALAELRDRRLKLLPDDEKAALADAIARVAAMAWELRGELAELDVNPLALTHDGAVLALDALMSFDDRTIN